MHGTLTLVSMTTFGSGTLITSTAHLLVLIGSNCLAFGLLSLGLVCCLAPALAAEMYGLPLPSPNDATTLAWVRVAGLRDAGLGLAALALFMTQRSAGSRCQQ